MTDRELVNRNVLVLPPAEIAGQAIAVSETITQEFPTEFTLNQTTCLPHLSLYQAPYPAENGDQVLAAVHELATALLPITVTMNLVGLFWETLIFWDAIISPEIRLMHELLLRTLNPLRDGELLPIHRQILEDRGVEQLLKKSIRLYGNPLCSHAFRPHITLSRCKKASDATAARQLWQGCAVSFTVTKLVVGEVGPHGTLPKILAEFPLKLPP